MSFARNIGNKYGRKISGVAKSGKKILDNSLSAGKDFAKIAGKKVLTKSAETTGDLIGNKIADRTKSAINKEQKEDHRIMEETQEIIIPPEKREQIIRDLKLF